MFSIIFAAINSFPMFSLVFCPISPNKVCTDLSNYDLRSCSPIFYLTISSHFPQFWRRISLHINSSITLHNLTPPYCAIRQFYMRTIVNVHFTPRADQPCFYPCHPKAALTSTSSYTCMSHALRYGQSAAAPWRRSLLLHVHGCQPLRAIELEG